MHASVGVSPQDEAYERCLKESRCAKEKGNLSMANNNAREASFYYKKGCLFLMEYIPGTANFEGDSFVKILALKGKAKIPPLSAKCASDVLDLYAELQNNLALAHLRLKRYAKGVECATKVLSLPGYSNNVKALLRRGNCHVQLGMLEEAERDLEALKCCAQAETVLHDTGVTDLLNIITQAKKKKANEEREMCKRMFELSDR